MRSKDWNNKPHYLLEWSVIHKMYMCIPLINGKLDWDNLKWCE